MTDGISTRTEDGAKQSAINSGDVPRFVEPTTVETRSRAVSSNRLGSNRADASDDGPRTRGTGGLPNLEVIKDFGTSPATHVFQLHTRVFFTDLNDLMVLAEMLSKPSAGRNVPLIVKQIIDKGTVYSEAGGRLARMLIAALEKGYLEGTGGLPNLEIITDYGPDQPTFAFELHTMVVFKNPDDADTLRDKLRDHDVPACIDLIVNKGDAIKDAARLRKMLEAAFS